MRNKNSVRGFCCYAINFWIYCWLTADQQGSLMDKGLTTRRYKLRRERLI